MKKVIVFIIFFPISQSIVNAQYNYLFNKPIGYEYVNPNFDKYSIKTIAIYVKGYPSDEKRSEEIKEAYDNSNLIRLLPLCNGANYSPPPTNLYSKIQESKDEEIISLENLVTQKAAIFFSRLNYKIINLPNFKKDKLKDQFEQLVEMNIDALVVIRFITIKEIVEMGNLNEEVRSYLEVGTLVTETKYSARIGKYKEGLALVPAIDIYDTKSCNIIYTSYGHCVKDSKKNIGKVQAIENLFTEQSNNLDEAASDSLFNFLQSDVYNIPKANVETVRKKYIVLTDKIINRSKDIIWNSYSTRKTIGYGIKIGYSSIFSQKRTQLYDPAADPPMPYSIINPYFCQGFNYAFILSYNNIEISMLQGVISKSPSLINVEDLQLQRVDNYKIQFQYLGLIGLNYHLVFSNKLSFSIGTSVGKYSFYGIINKNDLYFLGAGKYLPLDFGIHYQKFSFHLSYIQSLSALEFRLSYLIGKKYYKKNDLGNYYLKFNKML